MTATHTSTISALLAASARRNGKRLLTAHEASALLAQNAPANDPLPVS